MNDNRNDDQFRFNKLYQLLGDEVNQIYDVNETHCEECRNGYKGRIAVQEVLLIDDYLRDAINDEMLPREQLRELVYTENVTTLLQDGLQKVVEGITSFNEIYKLIEIDDELDAHYENEPLISEVEDDEETLPPEVPTTQEDNLDQTEVLDLGPLNGEQ